MDQHTKSSFRVILIAWGWIACAPSNSSDPIAPATDSEIIALSADALSQWKVPSVLGLKDARASSDQIQCTAIRYDQNFILTSLSCVQTMDKVQLLEEGHISPSEEEWSYQQLGTYDIAVIRAPRQALKQTFFPLQSAPIYQFQNYLEPEETGEQARFQYGMAVYDVAQSRARVIPVSIKTLWLDQPGLSGQPVAIDKPCRFRLGAALFKSMSEGPVWVGIASRAFDANADLCEAEDGLIFTDLTDEDVLKSLQDLAKEIL